MSKVLVLDGLSEEGVELFRKAGIEVDVKPPQKPNELAAIINDYDGLVVRSATKVTAEALEGSTRLKVIGHRQHRQGCRHEKRCCGDEHARRQYHLHMRARLLPYAFLMPQRAAGACFDAGRPLGQKEIHGHGTVRQNAGHCWRGTHWRRAGQTRKGLRDACACL